LQTTKEGEATHSRWFCWFSQNQVGESPYAEEEEEEEEATVNPTAKRVGYV